MATTVKLNTSSVRSSDENGIGVAVALVILALVLFMLFIYGLPLVLKENNTSEPSNSSEFNINLDKPAG